MEEVKSMEEKTMNESVENMESVDAVKTVFSEKQTEFINAGKRESLAIVSAALAADVEPDKVKEYMTPNLDTAQLIEQMVALIDGLPDETLKVFAGGGITAEDMRTLRLKSRVDTTLDNLMQEMRDLSDTVTDIISRKDITSIIRNLKSIKKDTEYITGNMLVAVKPDEEIVPEENEEPEVTPEMAAAAIVPETEQIGKEVGAAKSEREAVSSSAETAETEIEDTGIYSIDDSIIERTPQPKKEGRMTRFMAYLRGTNTDKVEHDENNKRLAVMEFLKDDLKDDQLEAVSEACRAGVPYEHLKYIVDKHGSADKIRIMSRLYMYIFDGSDAAAAAIA